MIREGWTAPDTAENLPAVHARCNLLKLSVPAPVRIELIDERPHDAPGRRRL